MKKTIFLLLSAMIGLLLLSGCSEEKPPDPYEGASNINFDLKDNFTVNIRDTSHYLLCSIVLELRDTTLSATLEGKVHRVNEIIINIIRAKAKEELDAADATTRLGEEITAALNAEFRTGGIDRTYFKTFFIN